MEKILQYAWKWRLYGSDEQRLVDGRRVRILNPGTLNTASGPDFFNAKILLDGCEWAGNVELHLRASDWWRHFHHTDPAYDSIILHVVSEDDARPQRSDGSRIPQLLFPLTEKMKACYRRLTQSSANPPAMSCAAMLRDVESIYITDVVNSAARERLLEKSDAVLKMVEETEGDWSKAAFCAVARSLGFGVNSQALEMLGRLADLNACEGGSDDIRQIEAVLFGQAGFLDGIPADDYQELLQREFALLEREYGLKRMPAHLWKQGGMRPASSPERRIALLARILFESGSLLSRMISARGNEAALRKIFGVETDGYWASHAHFGSATSQRLARKLSASGEEIVLINAVAPVCMAFAIYSGDFELEEYIQELLYTLPPEKNRIVRDWADAGICATNAAESQGLLQIRRKYCDNRDCMRCRLGHRLLRQNAIPVCPPLP